MGGKQKYDSENGADHHSFTERMRGKEQQPGETKSAVCVTCKPPQVCLSRSAHNDIQTNLKVIKEAHLLPISEQQGTEPAWVPGPQSLKEKKQTLDVPLLLDSGKNLIGLCSENFHKFLFFALIQ